MKVTATVVGAFALLPGLSIQHAAIMPPAPDRALKANSSSTPEGCKKLASDKSWPADSVWRSTFPGVYKKLRGTQGPDWMVQAKNIADVQKAVNFARDNNVRLTIITTGHDFHGRETARSGLRLDMGSFREPTVFSNTWKCGDTLKPATTSGKLVHEVETCKVKKTKRSLSSAIPQRNHDYKFFEKRDGYDCGRLLNLHKKRQTPDKDPVPGMDAMPGMAPAEVPSFNIINHGGKPAYARVAGGMYNELFFTQADKSGLMTVGAQHGGVSVTGGWMQAGGHNPFVRQVGMQVDNVMEMEVVTADGKFQKVSECNNPELYWALRGGGGSTFGVVTAMTVRVYPTFPVVVTRFFVNSTNEGIMDATATFLQEGGKYRDNHGLQGYFYVYPESFQSAMHFGAEYATMDNAKNATNTFMKKLEEVSKAPKHIEPTYYQYKTYREWYVGEYGDDEMEEKGERFLSWWDGSDGSAPSEAAAMDNPFSTIPFQLQFPSTAPQFDGTQSKRSLDAAAMEMGIMRSQPNQRHYLDSRILSDKQVRSVDIPKLSTAIKAAMPNIPGIHIRGFLYGGGKQWEPSKDAMGLLPEWRDATYHFITNAVPGWIRHDYNVSALARLFPDAGGYVNEAAPGDPDWKRAYWGDHYSKLESIKRKVDPNMVFWCSPCVGADILTYDDERLCMASSSNVTSSSKAAKVGSAPQTYRNPKTKVGIAAMPGEDGIPDPLTPIVMQYMQTKQAPPKNIYKSSFFKIAMGEGGSAGGKFANMDPYNPSKQLSDASWTPPK